jgi:hypothetical protein
MKFYISQETKQEIENYIINLEKNFKNKKSVISTEVLISCLKEIINSSTVLISIKENDKELKKKIFPKQLTLYTS